MIFEFEHKGKSIALDLYDHKEIMRSIIEYTKTFSEVEILDYILDNYPEHETIIDIGANIGNHSKYFQEFLKHDLLVCFEPYLENFGKLSLNLDMTKDVKTYNIALGTKKQRVGLKLNHIDKGNTVITETDNYNDIAMYTLDSIKIDNVTLMKIDVEGYEREVLLGAKETIATCHPIIIIEIWDNKYEQTNELLKEYGYKQNKLFQIGLIKTYEYLCEINFNK